MNDSIDSGCFGCTGQSHFEILVGSQAFAFCESCVRRRRRRNLVLCASALLAVWLVVVWRISMLLLDPGITAPWQAARAIPLVLVALYASAFLSFGIEHGLSRSGDHKTAEHWASQLAAKLRVNSD